MGRFVIMVITGYLHIFVLNLRHKRNVQHGSHLLAHGRVIFSLQINTNEPIDPKATGY